MSPINIVLCSDENYAPYCAVVLQSALAHSKQPENLHFYILTPGLHKGTATKLQTLVTEQNAHLDIIDATVDLPDEADLGRFGIGTVLRLTMHQYLPEACTRAIYLDSDVLVLRDIAELWDTNLQGFAVGAVTDLCSPTAYADRVKTYPLYCNAGVLLVNLSRWRAQRIGDRALQYLIEHGASLQYLDQDALNYVLSGNWLSLPLAWNFQETAFSAYERGYDYLRDRQQELLEAIEYPGIVYFAGGTKPWHPECKHPLQDLYLHFANQTPWAIDGQALKHGLPVGERLRQAARGAKTRRRRRLVKYKITRRLP